MWHILNENAIAAVTLFLDALYKVKMKKKSAPHVESQLAIWNLVLLLC
jgi:hypothetical protein